MGTNTGTGSYTTTRISSCYLSSEKHRTMLVATCLDKHSSAVCTISASKSVAVVVSAAQVKGQFWTRATQGPLLEA